MVNEKIEKVWIVIGPDHDPEGVYTTRVRAETHCQMQAESQGLDMDEWEDEGWSIVEVDFD